MMIDLSKFCIQKWDIRKYFQTPFSDAEHTYACNGYVVIKVPKIACIENYEHDYSNIIEQTEKYLFGLEGLAYQPIGELPPLNYKNCPTCKGVGQLPTDKECVECRGIGEITFSNSFNNYEIKCKSCDGAGSVEDSKNLKPCWMCEGEKQTPDSDLNRMTFTTGGASLDVDSAYVRLFADLPNAAYAVREKVLAIRFDDGYGMIMGMKEKDAT